MERPFLPKMATMQTYTDTAHCQKEKHRRSRDRRWYFKPFQPSLRLVDVVSRDQRVREAQALLGLEQQ